MSTRDDPRGAPPPDGVVVRGAASAEEVAAILGVLRPSSMRAAPDAYTSWRTLRRQVLRPAGPRAADA